ncbi:major facilitator superfamily domain-containing protein [Aspergillus oleicola]
MLLVNSLLPTALLQILQDTICVETSNRNHAPGPTRTSYNPCHSPLVHEELVLVHKTYQLLPVLGSIFCTVPYAFLADRKSIGRQRVLVLSAIGTSLALAWTLAVCYWRFAPVRSVWLSALFLLLGGGDSVFLCLVHVITIDVARQNELSKISLYFHAADVVAGFVGPALGSIMMQAVNAWAVLLLALILTLGRVALTRMIPETLGLRDDSAGIPTHSLFRYFPREKDIHDDPLTLPQRISILSKLKEAISSLFTIPPQATLLLLLSLIQTSATHLFPTVGLRYTSARFSLSYTSTLKLLRFSQGAQAVFVLVVLPGLMQLATTTFPWSAWARDRCFAIESIALTALGTILIGVAPSVNFEAGGLVLLAMGRCAGAFLFSLLQGAIGGRGSSSVSVVYGLAVTGGVVGRWGVGFVADVLLRKGVNYGGGWIGLPFWVVGGVMGVGFWGSLYIERKKDGN